MTRRVLGLFGGTFDPPHLGHVAAARAAIEDLGLDELLVTVAGEPQGKDAPPVAPSELRLEMARAAFASVASTTVSDVELRRAGPTFTIDTVESRLSEHPDERIFLVVGADAAAALGSWHRAGDLARLVEVAVVPRPGTLAPVAEGFSFRDVAMAPGDLSSTAGRAALREGADATGLVPEAVVHILSTNRMYAP